MYRFPVRHALPTRSILLGVCLLIGVSAHAAVPVEFELVTEPGFPLGGERRWLEMMQQIPDARLRVRSGQVGDRPSARPIGSPASPRFHVVGVLTTQNQLHLPGGTFRLEDRARIVAWINKLASEGADGLTAPRGPFGLTEDQLLEAHEALQRPVSFSTRDLPAAEFLRRVNALLPLHIEVDASARSRMPAGSVIRDELEGLTAGTALALAVRPFGIGVTIRRSAGATQIALIDPSQTKELWPEGWSAERPPRDTVPKMFGYLTVEIVDTPLWEALEAIEQRIEVRMLYDHNSLARHGIEPAEVRVKYDAGRTYYKRIFDNLLFQARLRSEIRTDEAGTPFLWITTVRK